MNELKEETRLNLITPLSDAYLAYIHENEAEPFRKVHRLIDLIEVFCKLYTTASLATFLHALKTNLEHEDSVISEESFTKIKVMLAAGLQTPSLGIWWRFAYDITQILHELQIPHILPGAEKEILQKKSLIKKAFDGENNLITFRNKYAHGATPSNEMCQKDLEAIEPRVIKLLEIAESFQQVNLVLCSEEGAFLAAKGQELQVNTYEHLPLLPNHTWFNVEDRFVDAYPLLNFKLKDNNADFFFYNDLKEKYANYLNYPNATHLKDANLKQEILKYIPLDDWKKISKVEMEPFRQIIEMLTEVFRGRREELGKIASFLKDENNRFLCIWGAPGVGKSTLLARSSQIIKAAPEHRQVMEEGNDWSFTDFHLVEYFIRNGSSDTAADFFNSMSQRLDVLFKLKLEIGKTDNEKKYFFEQRLQQISTRLKDDACLVLIIDGLDEIKHSDPLLSLLPKLVPEKIKVIFGARPQQELRFTFYDQLDRERRAQFELEGLKLEDIRAILMEHVNKYEIDKKYIENILVVSQGNPLYLKLLCLGLEQNIYTLNDSGSLPKGIAKMDELYQNALLHLDKEYPGTIQFLLFLAAAKDFVSPELMAEWLQVSTPHVRNHLLYASLEFLYENAKTQLYDDYQLFHESLREYLKKTYPSDYQACQERICEWSLGWKSPNGDIAFEENQLSFAMYFTTEYLFESFTRHLSSNRKGAATERRNQLFALVENEEWRAINFETCGNGEALGKSYYYLQKIVAKEDETGDKMNDFITYAINRYLEPDRMYLAQRKLLSTPTKKEDLTAFFERVPSLAKMGEHNEDKVLLALLPFWSNDKQENDSFPILEEKIEEWLENSDNTAIKKLWLKTRMKK